MYLSEKKPKTTGSSIKETRQYHERYLRAINNPLRRDILRALKEGSATIGDLELKTGLDDSTLKWHLDILERGFCIEKDDKQRMPVYKLTREGKVVDYIG